MFAARLRPPLRSDIWESRKGVISLPLIPFSSARFKASARIDSNSVRSISNFSGTGTVEFNRQKSPWPKDAAEADQIWRDRIEGELLDRTLMADKVETPVKVVLQEAVHLAERYGTTRSARFVNGVLDAYARKLGRL